MLRLDLERELPCPPAAAWPLIAEPALMNTWSVSRVEALSPGDGGHPAGTGALRRVHLAIRPHTILTEIIERAEAPRRLDYRVIDGAPIRHHLGSLHVLENGRGSLLRWEIEMEFVAPGLAWLAERWVAPGLDASLDRLVQLAAAPPAGLPPPPRRDLDEPPDQLLALREAAEAAAADARALADRLLLRGDDRGHFARTFQYVIEDLAAAVDNERYDHPGWVLRVIAAAEARFAVNLRRSLGEAPGALEPHWARAFDETLAARRGGGAAYLAARASVLAGLRAHVEDDLPRALADTFASYAGRCDYARFLPDFLRMDNVFADATDRLFAAWPRHTWPAKARLLDALTPRDLRAQLHERTFFPIARARRLAFARGGDLVAQAR